MLRPLRNKLFTSRLKQNLLEIFHISNDKIRLGKIERSFSIIIFKQI
jgi:hypothetical protein